MPNWAFREKFSIYQEYGTCFILVTPTGCELFVADRDAARDVLSRRNDFPKPIKLLGKLDVFGKNVSSVEGTEWKRHRRLVAKALHEKVNDAVWAVSAKQAIEVLSSWTNAQSVHTTQTDMTRLSLNVLFKACIDVNEDTEGNSDNTDSCQRYLTNFLNDITRPKPLGYRASQKMKANAKALGSCLKQIVETRLSFSSSNSQADLLSFLLHAAEENGLANREITGNLFMVMFAGHETTANALVYIIYLLAIFPSYQTWVTEEVDRLFTEEGQVDYSQSYTRIVRLRALLYETLRLYGAVPTIFRDTNSHNQLIHLSGRRIVVPRNTRVNISAIGLHTDPEFWGSDCHAWRPNRWIDQTKIASDQETICSSKTNSLFAWSMGSRVCPGQKFSQVEVLSVLLHLLRRHRVEIVPRPGQDIKEAQKQAYSLVEESRVLLTLHIPRADSVNVRWTKR
ncbi:cytochrome P450 monooxygenase [Aspergillus affinis]|uniref:cytochrome P450 monooxygenase n=1 Tax=Aspergillus affinis TaxID=1070780 RepID=UPI0022FE0D1C|nr:cytochrome P450 monooxygenase [Aspergillus affinis]KAI9037555.1 cytochrome P450 monooxygenase [Aspergillus affinis]